MATIGIPKSNDDPYIRYKRQLISVKVIKGYTVLTNLDSVCHSIDRPESVIISFLSKTLGTGSNGKDKLRGTFSVSTLETHIENYIINHVLCKTCQNPETYIDKNKIRCKACGFSRSDN